LQKIHNLGGERNARRILSEMEPFLCHFRDGEKIYYLSKEGRQRIGCTKVRKKTLEARHYLMRNDLYIHFNQPAYWKNEMKIGVKDVVTIITDALFKLNNRYHFVEVDHTQKMSNNEAKVQRYKQLKNTGVFQEQYGHFPQLVWTTTTDYRRKRLEGLCEGLDAKVFTVEDFK
jgi:hypothetical protein